LGVSRGTINLATLDGEQAVTIEKISARRDRDVVGAVGQAMPLHATAAGKMLLAHAPRGIVDGVLSGHLRSYTESTIVNPDRLSRELEAIRAQGIAVAREEMNPGDLAAAAPIWLNDVVVAAVSIVVASRITDERKLASLARSAGNSISRSLFERCFQSLNLEEEM
jgi:DNA-binding IclR family transcriptional regulator